MKIAVIGSREFFKDKIHECIDSKNQNLITEIIAETFQDGTIFISGGAIGQIHLYYALKFLINQKTFLEVLYHHHPEM